MDYIAGHNSGLMKKGKKVLLIIVILLLSTLLYHRWQNLNAYKKDENIRNSQKFDRRSSKINYTEFALCRMKCGSILKADVEEIMRRGEINYAITNVAKKPCPTYALQGYTTDNQHLRVIFAQCDNSTEVVTLYNLEKEIDCLCQADEKKNN